MGCAQKRARIVRIVYLEGHAHMVASPLLLRRQHKAAGSKQCGTQQIRARDSRPGHTRISVQRFLQSPEWLVKLDGVIVHLRDKGQAKWTLLGDLRSGRPNRPKLDILRARHVSQQSDLAAQHVTGSLEGDIVTPLTAACHLLAVIIIVTLHIWRVQVRLLAQLLNNALAKRGVVGLLAIQLQRQGTELAITICFNGPQCCLVKTQHMLKPCSCLCL
mmetsp:Transcript_17900/g.34927  ORF Transcript_17900/g.34927 Transcript_17900/m.34927 type:complete len:217 (+) Transcript_17900:134-784(+)